MNRQGETAMRLKGAKITNEFIVIPTFGWINERYYYGYPVIAIAFAWLCRLCGCYTNEHDGACNDCKWLERRST